MECAAICYALAQPMSLGKDDQVMQQAFYHVLAQLQQRGAYRSVSMLLQAVEKAMAEKKVHYLKQ